MSIEKKFHKLIQSHGREERDAILADIYARMPELAPKSKPAKKFAKRNMWFAIGAPVAAALCLAVILPCVLNDRKPQNIIPLPTFRFVSSDNYVTSSGTSIKEYGESNNISFDYFDWYAHSELDVTTIYTQKSDNSFLGISEVLLNTQTSEELQLFIADAKIVVDVMKPIVEACVNVKSDDRSIRWGITSFDTHGMYEKDDYIYFITLIGVKNENRLFELVAELLD